jgi:hypothetical protein
LQSRTSAIALGGAAVAAMVNIIAVAIISMILNRVWVYAITDVEMAATIMNRGRR